MFFSRKVSFRFAVVSQCCSGRAYSIDPVTRAQSRRRKVSINYEISSRRFVLQTRVIFLSNWIYISSGELPSSLVIHTDDRNKRFMFSLDSWLLETNTIDLKDNPQQANSTEIEWTVHTKRRSILFQVRGPRLRCSRVLTAMPILVLVPYFAICKILQKSDCSWSIVYTDYASPWSLKPRRNDYSTLYIPPLLVR